MGTSTVKKTKNASRATTFRRAQEDWLTAERELRQRYSLS